MTQTDKDLFDEIFHDDKYFKHVSDIELLRSARDCNCLYEWLEKEVSKEDISSIDRYMHFAYWLGVFTERNKKRRL